MLEQKNQPTNHTDEWLDGNPNHPQAHMATTSAAAAAAAMVSTIKRAADCKDQVGSEANCPRDHHY